MKKILGIFGGISSFVGFIMYLSAKMVIVSNTRYTWEPPYTQFEAQYITIKIIGTILLISGLLDIGLLLASKIYTSKTIQDPTSNEIATTKCPVCGLTVQKTTNICPKCNTSINEYRGE